MQNKKTNIDVDVVEDVALSEATIENEIMEAASSFHISDMMTIEEYLNPNEELYTHLDFSDDDFIEMSTQDENEVDDEPQQQLSTMAHKLETIANMCAILNESEDNIVLPRSNCMMKQNSLVEIFEKSP